MPESSETATERYRLRPETVVTDRGEGPAIVFAHGTLMDRTMYDPQIDALSDDYRTVAYDLRARTDQCATEYDLYDLADDADALTDALDIDTFVLCGMSMGGFMALRFAKRYPEQLAGVVLIDAIAEPHTDEEREQYRQMAAQIRADGAFADHLVDVAKNQLFGATTLEENPGLVEHWTERWRTYPPEGSIGRCTRGSIGRISPANCRPSTCPCSRSTARRTSRSNPNAPNRCSTHFRTLARN